MKLNSDQSSGDERLEYRREDEAWLRVAPKPELPPPDRTSLIWRVLSNLGWGIGMAVTLATVLSLWVLLLSLLRGSTQFDRYGMTAWEIIGAYFIAAGLVGALIGLLRPITRWRVGAIVLGILGGAISYSVIGVAMDGWEGFQWWIAAGPGAFVGGACA